MHTNTQLNTRNQCSCSGIHYLSAMIEFAFHHFYQFFFRQRSNSEAMYRLCYSEEMMTEIIYVKPYKLCVATTSFIVLKSASVRISLSSKSPNLQSQEKNSKTKIIMKETYFRKVLVCRRFIPPTRPALVFTNLFKYVTKQERS